MKNYRIECQNCGTFNTVSNSLFGKKTITCISCGKEIVLKDSRFITKRCKYCGTVFAFDQKRNRNFCPACNKDIGAESETVKYSKKNVICPKCNCKIEINTSLSTAQCSLCGEIIDVARLLAKEKLVSSDGINEIKFEGDHNTIVFKSPVEDFNMGSLLTVHESQEAVFFMNGQAFGPYIAGRHELKTESLPFLKNMYASSVDGASPFHSEIYFINKALLTNINWGLKDKIMVKDPRTGIPFEVGIRGSMNLIVSDSKKLLYKIVGTENVLRISPGSSISSCFPSFAAQMNTRIASFIASAIPSRMDDLFDTAKFLSEFSDDLLEIVTPIFAEYGFTPSMFNISEILLPEDDAFKRIRELYIKKSLSLNEIDAEIDIEKKKRELEREKSLTAKDVTVIGKTAEAEGMLAVGKAEADVMQFKGYSHQDEIQAEISKAWAEGVGKMGSNTSNGSNLISSFISTSIGVGLIAKYGKKTVLSVLENLQDKENATTADKQVNNVWKCKCGKENKIDNLFCGACGEKRTEKSDKWYCGNCGAENTENFCVKCGKKKND